MAQWTVAASADDAHERADGTGFSYTSAVHDISSSALASSRGNAGLRFTSINIPAGSTILTCTIEIYVGSKIFDDINVELYFEDVDDAVDFNTGDPDVTSRDPTDATVVPWSADAIAPTPAYVTSPDFTAHLQEIVDRVGWASGQDVVVLIRAKSDATKNCECQSADGANTPKLNVTWLAAVILAPTGIVSAEAFGTLLLDIEVTPTGIASAEAFGTAVVAHIVPSGIASAEAFGTASVNMAVAPTAIASAEAFGTPTLTKLREAVYSSTVGHPLQYSNRTLHVKSNGDRYAIIPDGAAALTELNCLKNSADPWAKQDNANRPTGENNITGVYSDLASDGKIHIIWQRHSSNTDVRYVTFDTTTDTWGTVETVRSGTSDAFNHRASISLDSSDKPHVIFVEDYLAIASIYYTEKTGASWSSPVRVSHGSGLDVACGSIYLDSSDVIHVFWLRALIPVSELFYRQKIGGSWQSIETVESTDVASTNTAYPSIAVDASDNPGVLWWQLDTAPDPDLWRFYFSESEGGGSWSKVQVATFPQPAGSLEWGSDLLFASSNWGLSHRDGQADGSADLFLRRSPSGTAFGASTEIATDRGWDWSRLCYGRNQQNGAYMELLIESGTDIYWEQYDITTVAGPLVISPSAISSAEAFGALQVNLVLISTGIVSAETFGTPVLAGPITATAIASAEAFGTLSIGLAISPVGIASVEAVSSPIVTGPITTTGIASAEAFGTPQVNLGLTVGGIASAEAFGTSALTTGAISVSLTGIASAEAFGAATLTVAGAPQTVGPTGIASTEAFGAATVTAPISQTLSPTGVASAEAFGSAIVAGPLSATGIASLEVFGTLTITTGAVSVTPGGIASAEAFGTLTLQLQLRPTGIGSAETFGSVTITGAFSQLLSPTGIASLEVFGSLTVALALPPQTISPIGIASLETIGAAVVAGPITVAGIASTEAFGTLTLTIEVLPAGIASAEVFGALSVILALPGIIEPSGIASVEAFGTARLTGVLISVNVNTGTISILLVLDGSVSLPAAVQDGSIALLTAQNGLVSLPNAVNAGTISIKETEDATI